MFISFGYLTKKCLLFIAVPIIMIIRRKLTYSIPEKIKNMFYFGFIKFLGTSLNGIFWLIIGRTIVSNKKEEKENKDKILLAHDPNQQNNDMLNESQKRYNFSSQYELN